MQKWHLLKKRGGRARKKRNIEKEKKEKKRGKDKTIAPAGSAVRGSPGPQGPPASKPAHQERSLIHIKSGSFAEGSYALGQAGESAPGSSMSHFSLHLGCRSPGPEPAGLQGGVLGWLLAQVLVWNLGQPGRPWTLCSWRRSWGFDSLPAVLWWDCGLCLSLPTRSNAVSPSFARCEGIAPPGLVLCPRKLAVPYLAIDLVCLWEEVNSGSSQSTVWNRNPHIHLFLRSTPCASLRAQVSTESCRQLPRLRDRGQTVGRLTSTITWAGSCTTSHVY